MAQTFFRRNEKKYVLSPAAYTALEHIVKQHMVCADYFRSNIANIYFDTEHDDIIAASLENPDYKYKIRARSYGIASSGSVFLEIKSKLHGTVYKRRTKMSLREYNAYLTTGRYPDNQVMREIHQLFTYRSLRPRAFVAYDRTAYSAMDTTDLRLTFDANLRSRTHALNLEKTDECEYYFDNNTCILEIKATRGLPEWLRLALTTQHIYPSSFSKYGTIYQKHRQQELYHA